MGRYISAGDLTQSLMEFVGTAGTKPGELEWFVQIREDEVQGRLGRVYNTHAFSGSAPPIIQTLVRLGASVDYRKSKISMEDPSVSQWITQDEEKFDKILTGLLEGEIDIITASGTIIEPISQLRDQVWSSVSQYKPTMDLRDPTEQRVSRTRILDERDADLADSGSGVGN